MTARTQPLPFGLRGTHTVKLYIVLGGAAPVSEGQYGGRRHDRTAQCCGHTPFRLEEATIDQLHMAIRTGQTTYVAIVRHYIERAQAYNGVASMLVTEDGSAIPETFGAVRGRASLRFPTATVKASAILPDLDKYRGPPLEFGRMEATASDPDVQSNTA